MNEYVVENNQNMLDQVLSVRKALFIGAHPDDIEFYCGGLVYMLLERGAEVVFAVATRGGRGKTGRAKERMESLRTRHQHDAARVLGGARVVFFNYPDKHLQEHIELLTEELRLLIESEAPDMVFSWDPEHIYNPHPDHRAAAQAGHIAASGLLLCYYGTTNPNLRIGYDESVFRVKLRALRAHRTEVPWFYYPLVKRMLIGRMKPEGEKVGSPYAEVLRCGGGL